MTLSLSSYTGVCDAVEFHGIWRRALGKKEQKKGEKERVCSLFMSLHFFSLQETDGPRSGKFPSTFYAGTNWKEQAAHVLSEIN